MTHKEAIYILDASGYLYRSYFAIRNVTNAKGESTNALFGFIRSLLKLRKDFKPHHLVAVFDGPQNIQKREAIYSDYKAHRAGMPPDLIYQIGWAQHACELLGIPYLAVPGVEADDTMGTIALWAAKQGLKAYLCTSDKDLYQLVNDQIAILNTHKDNLILGPKEVKEAFGVTPEQMIDFLAITGDASDNVPGVPGFGPKTASSLLQQYGTLDYILKHPEVVPGKKQEVILQNTEQALLSRRLVTIHTDVPIPAELDFFEIKQGDPNALREFYASMNFNSLIRELEQEQQAHPKAQATPSSEHHRYTLIDDEAAFDSLMHLLAKHKEISLNTKATHPQPLKADLVGIAFSVESNTAWYIPANGKLGLQRILKGIKGLLENPDIGFYGHNIKYDYQVLANYHIHIAHLIFDTMIASYLLNSHIRQHTLEHLVLDYLNKVKPPISDLLGKGKKAVSVAEVLPETLSPYCCEDADDICRLKSALEAQLKERNIFRLLTDLEIPLLYVLAHMERNGIFVDLDYLKEMSSEVLYHLRRLEDEIYSLAGETFNINSPKQLSAILFTKLGIKPPRKTATGLSTDADVLDSLQYDYPIAGKILEYRTLEKLRSTYIDTLPLEINPKTKRVHCTFNQTVAATGRLSCQDPNLQNIPIRTEIGRKIRGAFRPEKKHWSYLAADYSQIELRLLAHLSEDPHLLQAFKNGEDIHTHTAAHIFNIPPDQITKAQRHNAKAVNFGIIYGQQAFGLAQELGIDVKEAAAFIERYFHQYKRVKEYMEECKQQARQTGKTVTYIGRERLIPEINSKNGQIRAAAERLAINTPLQGTAADLIKMAMLQIDQKFRKAKMSGYMVLQIHDELIFELPDEEIHAVSALVRDSMEHVLTLKVPLVVDIAVGKNWAEC